MTDRPVQDLLYAWGRSRHLSDARSLGYPSQAAFAREMRTPGRATVRVPSLSDDEHGRVERAVMALKRRSEPSADDHRYRVLVGYYCARDGRTPGEAALARRLGLSRDRVRTARIAAEAWVEAMLDAEQDRVGLVDGC